jgi:N-acetylmuramoyl-L-alanine amidase
MMQRITVWLVLLMWGGGMLTAAEKLEKVKWQKKTYVTVDSLCRYLGMEPPTFPEKGPVEITNARGESLKLEMYQRSMYMNGLRAWLSFPVSQNDKGQAIITELDVEKLILPIMRPLEFLKKREIKGVVIDPGHGGADRGARSRSGYTEKESALETAFYLRDILKAKNIPYVMTRDKDVFVSLSERARIANQYPDYAFVSIHYNSAHHAAHGVETYAMTPQGAGSTSSGGRVRHSDHKAYSGNKNDLHNIVLTHCIHKEMAGLHTKKGDRGIKRARFVVLRQCECPGVLVEGGFMTSPLDRVLIEGDTYKKKVAEAIYRGVASYMDLCEGRLPGQKEKPDKKKKEAKDPGETAYELLKDAVVKKELDNDTASPVNAKLFADRQAAIRHRLEVALRQASEKESGEAEEEEPDTP